MHKYELHGHLLKRPKELSIKYLGVTIQADLKWSSHIGAITAKANRTLGLLKRNIRVPEPDVRARAYKSLVRPQVEFASSVWDPPPETRALLSRNHPVYAMTSKVSSAAVPALSADVTEMRVPPPT